MLGIYRFEVSNYLGFKLIVGAWASSPEEARDIILTNSEYPVKDICYLDGDVPLFQPLRPKKEIIDVQWKEETN